MRNNRIIKFRVWDDQRKQFRDDVISFQTEENNIVEVSFENGEDHFIKKDGFISYPSSQIQQFTGLHDKNGKEIYEGDIVEAWSAGSKGIFQVKWRQEGSPCWLLYPNFQERQHWSIHATEHKVGKQFISVDGKITTTDLDGFYDDGLTVIGNIHQNAELLK